MEAQIITLEPREKSPELIILHFLQEHKPPAVRRQLLEIFKDYTIYVSRGSVEKGVKEDEIAALFDDIASLIDALFTLSGND